MGRKKKLINKTDIPQYAVERFARCVFDDIRADYARPEVQAEFARWQAQRAELNTKKKRAAVVTAPSVYVVFFCMAFSVWILAEWLRHWENTLVRIS